MGAAISRNGRAGKAASRRREALSELNRRLASGGAAAAPTAKALCDLAGVSRNALTGTIPPSCTSCTSFSGGVIASRAQHGKICRDCGTRTRIYEAA